MWLLRKKDLPDENVFSNPNSCNIYSLIDIYVYEICQLESSLIAEDESQPRRPHSYVK